MECVLLVVLFWVLMTVAGVVVMVRAVRAVRRSALAAADRVALTARSLAIGPTGELARLRRDLASSLAALHRAVGVARAGGTPLGDVPGLLARLELAAGTVDAQLRLLESLRDPARVQAGLAAPRSEALAVITSARDLADGLLASAARVVPDLAVLQAECAIESDALRARDRRGALPG